MDKGICRLKETYLFKYRLSFAFSFKQVERKGVGERSGDGENVQAGEM